MAIRPIDSKSEFDVRLLTRSESLKKSDERAAATINELADKIKTEGSGTALEMLGNLALHEDQDLALAAMNKLNSLYADTFDMAIQSVIERVNQIRANPWPRDGMAGEPAGGGAASRPAATRAQPDDWGHEKRPIGVSTYTSSASARPDEGSRDSESENRYTPRSRRRASSVYGPLPNQVRHRQPVFSDAAVQVGGGDTGTQSETPADNQATGAGRRESGQSINQTVNVRIKIAGTTGTTTQTHMSQPAGETTAAAGTTGTETQPLPQSDVQAGSQTEDVADQTESLETRGMTTQGESPAAALSAAGTQTVVEQSTAETQTAVAQSTAGTQTAVEQNPMGTQTVAAVRVDTDSQTELQQPKSVEVLPELRTEDVVGQTELHETNEIATQAGTPAAAQSAAGTQTAVEQSTTETQTNTKVLADTDSQTELQQPKSVEVQTELRTGDVAVQVGSHETNEIATQAGTPAAALSAAGTQTVVEQSTAGTQTVVEQSMAETQTAVEQSTTDTQTNQVGDQKVEATRQRLGVFLEEVLRMTQIDKHAAEMALKEVFEGMPKEGMKNMAEGVSRWYSELDFTLGLEPEEREWEGLVLSASKIEEALHALPQLNDKALQSLQPIAKKLERFVEGYRASAGQRSAAVGDTKSEQPSGAMVFRRTLRRIYRLGEEDFIVPEYFPTAEDFMAPPGSHPTAVAIGGMLGELVKDQEGRDLLRRIIKLDDDGENLEMSLRNGMVTFSVGDGKDYEMFMQFQPNDGDLETHYGIHGNVGMLLDQVITLGYAGGNDLDAIRDFFPLGGYWLDNIAEGNVMRELAETVRHGNTVFFRLKDGRLGRVVGVKKGENRQPEAVLIVLAGSDKAEEVGIKDFPSRLAVKETKPGLFVIMKDFSPPPARQLSQANRV